MFTYKILSIDESGKASSKHLSKEFALIGVVINEKYKVKLSNKIAKLKKIYFNNDEVVLHYNEIARKIGVFKILKNNNLEVKFWSDILSILNSPQINYFFTLVDKEKSRKAGWLDKTVVQRSYSFLIKMYVCHLSKYEKGKIITESDTSQDPYLAKAHNDFQTKGIPECSLSGKNYWEKITSLSFVNKKNYDPEIELADLLGSTIRLKYRIENKKFKKKICGVELKKLKLVNRKILKNNSNYAILI